MKSNNESVLEYILGLYFHVEHGFGIEDVKKYLNNPKSPERSDILKKELVDAVSQNQIPPNKFEKLTGEEMEMQEEVNEFLINEIWNPLYGDKPILN